MNKDTPGTLFYFSRYPMIKVFIVSSPTCKGPHTYGHCLFTSDEGQQTILKISGDEFSNNSNWIIVE